MNPYEKCLDYYLGAVIPLCHASATRRPNIKKNFCKAMSSGRDAQNQPQAPPNAYERWTSSTPPATRFTCYTIVCFYVLTFFSSNVLYAFSNIPIFVLHGEVWRPFLSSFFSNGLFSVVFIAFTLSSLGARLERALGTLCFTHLVLSTVILTNLTFLLWCLMLAYNPLYQVSSALIIPSIGFWPIIMALIVVECSIYPAPTRQLLFFPAQIPTKYYPLALLLLFSLFSFSWDMPIGMGMGYLRVFGWLQHISPSNNTLQRIENQGGGLFEFLITAEHYVSVSDAIGGAIFNDIIAQPDQNAESDVENGRGLWGGFNTNSTSQNNAEHKFPGTGHSLSRTTDNFTGTGSASPDGESIRRAERARLLEDAALKRSKKFSQGGAGNGDS